MRRPNLLVASLLLVSPAAHAHGEAVVFALLLWVGVFGGVIAGALEAVNPWRKLGPGWWFAIYLVALAVFGSIAAGSLEAAPYAVGYGAFLGVVPFMILFFLSRFLATAIRSYRSSSRSQSNSTDRA
jgi:hypothetical protein